jgi:hypothetical protein
MNDSKRFMARAQMPGLELHLTLVYTSFSRQIEVFVCAGAERGESELLDLVVSSLPMEMLVYGTLGVMPVFPDGTIAKDTPLSSGYHRI